MAFSLLFFGTHPWHERGGMENRSEGKREREGRRSKRKSVTPPSQKKERRGESNRDRSFQLAWHDEGGLVARLLVRSMSSLSSSLSLPSLHTLSPSLFIPVPCTVSPARALSLASSPLPALFHRNPPHQQRSRAASRTRDTGACEIPLSSCERTPVRGQDYPAPVRWIAKDLASLLCP